MNPVNKKFWLVWNKDGFPPRYMHDSEKSAKLEAERLAKENHGKMFIVLQSISAKIVNPIIEVKFDANAYDQFEDDIPF